LLVGLEVDHLPGANDHVADLLRGYPFDALLGSVHRIGAGFGRPRSRGVGISELTTFDARVRVGCACNYRDNGESGQAEDIRGQRIWAAGGGITPTPPGTA
jgi:histidinol phosphatase-like PHP family hydrolase